MDDVLEMDGSSCSATSSPRPARNTVASIHIGTATPRSLGRTRPGGSSASHARACSLAETSAPARSNESRPGRSCRTTPSAGRGGASPSGADRLATRRVAVWAKAARPSRRSRVMEPQGLPSTRSTAKLVVEPVRAQEPPVTPVAGGGPQGGHRNPGAGDVAVQVDVLEQQLPAPELRAGVGVAQVEAFHPRRGRGQPGARVGRQPHGRVEWDQPAQAGRGFGEDGGGVGSLDPENELVTPPPEGGGLVTGTPAMVARPGVGRNPANGGLPWPVPAIGDGTQRRAPRRWVAGERHEAKERPIVLRATTTLDDLKDELTGGLVLPGGPWTTCSWPSTRSPPGPPDRTGPRMAIGGYCARRRRQPQRHPPARRHQVAAPVPIVLVPGLLTSPRLFSGQLPAVWRHGPVTIADNTRDDTIAAIASRILADAPPRFALAGLSMGGYISLEIVRQAPDRIDRLALLDTSARPDNGGDRAAPGPDRAGPRRPLRRDRRPAVPPAPPSRHGDPSARDLVRLMADETGLDAFIRQQQAIMGRVDSRPGLGAIDARRWCWSATATS